jgi:hypothetical protein
MGTSLSAAPITHSPAGQPARAAAAFFAAAIHTNTNAPIASEVEWNVPTGATKQLRGAGARMSAFDPKRTFSFSGPLLAEGALQVNHDGPAHCSCC